MKIENPLWTPFYNSLTELKRQVPPLAAVVPKGDQLVVQLEVLGRSCEAKAKHSSDLKQMMETYGAFISEVRMMIAEGELHGVDSDQDVLQNLMKSFDEKRNLCISHLAGHP